MENNNKHSLLQPLITPISSPTTTTAAAAVAAAATSSTCYSLLDDHNYDPFIKSSKIISNTNFIFRILLVFLVASISIWANYEASRTFDINIVNDSKDSQAGKRFDLFYVSNDKATRIVLNTSSFVEHFLYNNNSNNIKPYTKKHIKSVTLRLVDRNLTAAAVTAAEDHHASGKYFKGYNYNYNYVIDINPMLIEDKDYNNMTFIVVGAIQRAMARIWLWDGGSRAPPRLVDGMVEYIVELAGFGRKRVSGGGGGDGDGGRNLPDCGGGHSGWWEDKEPKEVAHYLQYYENYKKGFIQRLNEAMKDTWHDRMVDDVLGFPSMKICGLYNASFGSVVSPETRFV
ncbi:hypothetical protein HN51_061133 [Arachis hypogaea]|uniref:uncharacterized protein LOC107616097 n=1 Tax=Arachis ipaensis TaxID=130454 RepID=UPI0007AF4BA7|nr:uncharacterized protein LOC107616097 [Arachis ipaensis]XP_025626309.1 uncharacterized protein LOC112719813 [Arachis hypogaea]